MDLRVLACGHFGRLGFPCGQLLLCLPLRVGPHHLLRHRHGDITCSGCGPGRDPLTWPFPLLSCLALPGRLPDMSGTGGRPLIVTLLLHTHTTQFHTFTHKTHDLSRSNFCEQCTHSMPFNARTTFWVRGMILRAHKLVVLILRPWSLLSRKRPYLGSSGSAWL